jgi:hypothetical protein
MEEALKCNYCRTYFKIGINRCPICKNSLERVESISVETLNLLRMIANRLDNDE